MQLYEMTASQLSGLLQRREISARQLCESLLQRIGQAEPHVGAYLTVTAEQALEQAGQVDAQRAAGQELHPLAGIPTALKDNLCTRGVKTTCASKMLYNFVPPYDATVVTRLQQAGLVFLGKVNMDEFAMGSSCENSAFQKTHNPHDLSRVPGGSSGGSAAALAAGEAVLALGSDTGGSIRQPASYCGVVGLKPTYGSVSRYGLVAFASSLDQIGPMGRSVEDVSSLYGLICGRDPMDATSAAREYPDFGRLDPHPLQGLRIGIPDEYYGEGVDPAISQAVRQAVDKLAAQGAVVVPVSLPSSRHALSAYYIIASAEASSNLARFDGVKYGYRAQQYDSLTDMFERTRSEGFGDEVKRRIMLGTFVLSSGFYDAYYNKAKRTQQQIAAEFGQAFSQCDLLITPTAPTTAFKIGENIGDPVKMYMADILTVPVNIAGLPGLSLPCGKDGQGLPIGMQLIGPRFSELLLLRTGLAWEQMCGGFGPLPAIG